MNQRSYDEISDISEEDLGLIRESDSRSTRSRTAERASLELRQQSFGRPYGDRNETGESYLQDQSFHRHSSNLPRLQHQQHQQQGCQKERTQRTRSSSAIPSPDVESFQLFDITHQSLWGSFPEPCGPCPPSMTGSACSSGSMFASTTGSIMLGLEDISCCGDSRAALERLGRFFNNRSLSDITLKVGSRSFRSHRLVLVNTSDVFERMFCSRDWRESSRLVGMTYYLLV